MAGSHDIADCIACSYRLYCRFIEHSCLYCGLIQQMSLYCQLIQHACLYCAVIQHVLLQFGFMQHVCIVNSHDMSVLIVFTHNICACIVVSCSLFALQINKACLDCGIIQHISYRITGFVCFCCRMIQVSLHSVDLHTCLYCELLWHAFCTGEYACVFIEWTHATCLFLQQTLKTHLFILWTYTICLYAGSDKL